MPRTHSIEYAQQLEARARDIRSASKRRNRVKETRCKIILGALAESYAAAGPAGVRLFDAFAQLPALKLRDARFLADNLPPPLAAPFKAISQELDHEQSQ